MVTPEIVIVGISGSSLIKGEHPITYVQLDEHSVVQKEKLLFNSFRGYLEYFSRTYSVRSPVRNLRRKAKESWPY